MMKSKTFIALLSVLIGFGLMSTVSAREINVDSAYCIKNKQWGKYLSSKTSADDVIGIAGCTGLAAVWIAEDGGNGKFNFKNVQSI